MARDKISGFELDRRRWLKLPSLRHCYPSTTRRAAPEWDRRGSAGMRCHSPRMFVDGATLHPSTAHRTAKYAPRSTACPTRLRYCAHLRRPLALPLSNRGHRRADRPRGIPVSKQNGPGHFPGRVPIIACYFPPAVPCCPSHDASWDSCCDFRSTQLLMRSMDCL
jgi:hypothetical protein